MYNFNYTVYSPKCPETTTSNWRGIHDVIIQQKARPSVVPLRYPRLPWAIQKRGRPHIDSHKLPLRLPIGLTHGHQKVHGLSDLPEIRGSERTLMQMLQNAPVSVLQRRGHSRLKEISWDQAADQSGLVIGVLHGCSPFARIKRTERSYHKIL